MHTQQKDRQTSTVSGHKQDDQKEQQQNQSGTQPPGSEPEIETPIHNPEKTEKRFLK